MILAAKEFGYQYPVFVRLPVNVAMATILTMQRIRDKEIKEHDKALAELKSHGNKQKRKF